MPTQKSAIAPSPTCQDISPPLPFPLLKNDPSHPPQPTHRRPDLLARATNSKLHQMIHESLQTDVVGENRLGRLRDPAVAAAGMRGARIEFGEQEARLRAAGVADDKTREGEAVLDEVLSGELIKGWAKVEETGVERQSEGKEKLTRASSLGASSSSLKFSYPSISWYPALRHSAIVSPWKIRMWKNVSSSSTV